MEEQQRPPRLYVIIRANMTRSQQAIQAGHGVAKFVKEFPDVWGNRTLLYLRTSDETELMKWHSKLSGMTDKVVVYLDPSWNSNTAVAAFGTPEVMEAVKELSLI